MISRELVGGGPSGTIRGLSWDRWRNAPRERPKAKGARWQNALALPSETVQDGTRTNLDGPVSSPPWWRRLPRGVTAGCSPSERRGPCGRPPSHGDLAPPPQSRPPPLRDDLPSLGGRPPPHGGPRSPNSIATAPRSGTTPLPWGTSLPRLNRDLHLHEARPPLAQGRPPPHGGPRPSASIATSPCTRDDPLELRDDLPAMGTSLLRLHRDPPRFNRNLLHHEGRRPPWQRSPSSAVHRRAPLRQSSCPPPVTRPPPLECPPPPSRRSPPPRRRIPLSSRRTRPSRPGRPPPRLLLLLPPR